MDPSATITVVLADDHEMVRSGLRMLLHADERFEVLEEAGDVDAALDAVFAEHPRVLVLDLNMGGESSLDAIPRLRSEAPSTEIVVLTMQEDPAFARAAMGAGARGYVLKDAADEELLTAIALAADGRSYLNPELDARLATTSNGSSPPPDELSPRELEVLRLIALGHTNAEIAEALVLSVRTVETHRAHIHQKVPFASRAELVAYARERDLLQ